MVVSECAAAEVSATAAADSWESRFLRPGVRALVPRSPARRSGVALCSSRPPVGHRAAHRTALSCRWLGFVRKAALALLAAVSFQGSLDFFVAPASFALLFFSFGRSRRVPHRTAPTDGGTAAAEPGRTRCVQRGAWPKGGGAASGREQAGGRGHGAGAWRAARRAAHCARWRRRRGHGAVDRARGVGHRRLGGHRRGRGAGAGAARHEGGGVRPQRGQDRGTGAGPGGSAAGGARRFLGPGGGDRRLRSFSSAAPRALRPCRPARPGLCRRDRTGRGERPRSGASAGLGVWGLPLWCDRSGPNGGSGSVPRAVSVRAGSPCRERSGPGSVQGHAKRRSEGFTRFVNVKRLRPLTRPSLLHRASRVPTRGAHALPQGGGRPPGAGRASGAPVGIAVRLRERNRSRSDGG